MSAPNDDQHINRIMELLYSQDEESTETLRQMLEDALNKKYGHAKQIEHMKYKFEEPSEKAEATTNGTAHPPKRKSQEDSGRNADELVMNLLKDDLTCVTCRDMDVSAGNQLIECNGCHDLYHQECHSPYITDAELAGTSWMCSSCKYRARKAAKHAASSSSSRSGSGHSSSHSSSKSSSGKTSSSKPYVSNTSSKSSNSHGNASNTTKSSSSKSPSGSSSGSSSGHSSSAPKTHNSQSSISTSSSTTTSLPTATVSSTTSSAHRVVTPNINIVSADKRLQIMKRKAAAKIKEKRKVKNV